MGKSIVQQEDKRRSDHRRPLIPDDEPRPWETRFVVPIKTNPGSSRIPITKITKWAVKSVAFFWSGHLHLVFILKMSNDAGPLFWPCFQVYGGRTQKNIAAVQLGISCCCSFWVSHQSSSWPTKMDDEGPENHRNKCPLPLHILAWYCNCNRPLIPWSNAKTRCVPCFLGLASKGWSAETYNIPKNPLGWSRMFVFRLCPSHTGLPEVEQLFDLPWGHQNARKVDIVMPLAGCNGPNHHR